MFAKLFGGKKKAPTAEQKAMESKKRQLEATKKIKDLDQ